NCGQASENIEVVPFDDVSDCRGDDHAPEVFRNLRTSHDCFPYFKTLCFKASSLRGNAVSASRKDKNRGAVPSAEAKMADFCPSSYRCHVYELWSEDCRFIGDISVLRRAAVTDDNSPLPVAGRQDRPTDGKPDGPRLSVLADISQIPV